MASKIFKDYQGESIKIGGVCYKFAQETTKVINSDPSEIEGTFASCLECALESSSSSEQFSESSSSSENFSESSSSSENFSESSSSENFSESSSSSENFSESSSSSNCCLDLVYILQPCDDLFEGSDISSTSSAVDNVYIMCRSVANSLLDKFSSSSSDCPDVPSPHEGDTFWYFEFVTPGWDPNGFQIHRSPTDISGITSIDDVRAAYPYATIHLIDTIERGASCNALVDERIEIAGDVNGYRAWKFCSCYELWEWVKGSSSSSSSSSSFEPDIPSESSSSESGGDPAPKVCATVNGFVDPPDIIVRVSNLGATETVNWCGETWNLGAGGDNLKEFRVCPGWYILSPSLANATYHQWNFAPNTFGIDGLHLARILGAGGPSSQRNYLYFYWSGLGGPGVYDFRNSLSSFFDLGVINGVPIPTSGDRLITVVGDPDAYFGSYTDASNRTFTWRRGDKWP